MRFIKAIIFSFAIVLAALFLGNAYVDLASPEGKIAVTGLGSADFISNLIVWEGQFSRMNPDLKAAFDQLILDKKTVEDYLVSKGIKEENIIFNSVQTSERTENQYQNGNFVGTTFIGYELTQTVKVESPDVEMVENVSREVTKLLNRGVQFNSYAPRYYYTKLADLKIEMITKATEDARLRAENIAENSGGKLGKLNDARLGVFQITGQNSGEDYSWGGSFNTSDKKKTASITMRLEYNID
ncbi:MAG: SIMPL domain-containing protein [Flavobacteriales bacterium]|nr:SIMPL domain-containing protein [Flavobacteriales bacterium]